MSESNTDATKSLAKEAEIGDAVREKTVNLSSSSSNDEQQKDQDETLKKKKPLWRRAYDIAFWVPPNCRWDPNEPPRFSIWLNILFAFAGAFTVANLYYNHPILNILAHDFGVSYAKVSQIPTVAQAGYAAGLFFLCPLGDLLQRRPFVLTLVLFTATMSIGLCLTQSLAAFSAIQCIVGFTTVTPQLMLPLVGDLAPPNKRAASLSIVVSGFVLGILIARLLSGIMTQFTSWRNVYWMSVGLQYAIFGSLWMFMPDYPASNKRLNYFKMLWSMPVMLTKYPVLLQACLISYFTSLTFTNFWTVLTYLLSGAPYHYDPVTIGLFALIGISTMFLTPLYGRFVIDRFVPWFSVILGLGWCMLGICIGAYTGSFTVAGPILEAWFLDLGMQSAQVANRSSIYAIEPKARNRVNTCFMVFTFFGQLTGTSAGAHIYTDGGWIASQSFSVGAICMALLLTFARGPWEEGWVGWHGGFSIFKKNRTSADGKATEAHNPLRRLNTNERKASVPVEDPNVDRDLEKGDGFLSVEDQEQHRGEAPDGVDVKDTAEAEVAPSGSEEDVKDVAEAEKASSGSEDDIAPVPK